MMRTLWMACILGLPCFGQTLAAGRNTLDLRGRSQAVHYYPASGTSQATVLVLPGDGGWRGLAIEMAQTLAGAGMDVYGWDIKQYLTGFTNSLATLAQDDIQADTATIAARLGAGRSRRFVLVGWSQGAAMSVLAAGTPALHDLISGVVAIGLPESGVLGWRFADNLTYLTKAEPNEPKFSIAPWISAVAPVRLGMIHSTADEYVPAETAKRLFAMAREPKRLDLVSARSHRYDGNRGDFFRVLQDQVRWAAGN